MVQSENDKRTVKDRRQKPTKPFSKYMVAGRRQSIRRRTDQKTYLYEEYGIKEIGIFGSYTRSEQKEDSDIDILVELERPPRISLIGLVELQHYLGDLLGTNVDIAIKRNLKKRIGKRILSEVVPI